MEEGVIWDVSQRFQLVEEKSTAATDKLSMDYYKHKVEQLRQACEKQLFGDNVKFSSQLQAEETFQNHLVSFISMKIFKFFPLFLHVPPSQFHSKFLPTILPILAFGTLFLPNSSNS